MNKKVVIAIVVVLVLCCLCSVAGVVFFATRPNTTTVNWNVGDLSPNSPTDSSANDDSANRQSNSGRDDGKDDSASSSTKKGACDILTPEIAKKVLKVEVKQTASASTSSCSYSNAVPTLKDLGVLTIVVSEGPTAKTLFDTAKSGVYKSNTEEVTGLNAEGVYWAVNYKQLSILKGDRWILITTIVSSGRDSKTVSIEAAKEILANI
jgi:cytoskeletal protein RodZ